MRRYLFLLAGALVVVLVGPAGASNDPLFGSQWGMSKIGAEQAWSTGAGNGVVIAVVDSGADLDHPDLRAKILSGHDFVDGDSTPEDGNGHGTHVSGIAAAVTGNGVGVAGAAPGAKILPVRVLDNDGKYLCAGGCSDPVSSGIHWAADYGAAVINLSLADIGQEIFGASFVDALEYAWTKGSIPVVAAGNSFIFGSGFRNTHALVVAATDKNDEIASYSNGVGSAMWGISAPGGDGNGADEIISTWLGGQYAYLSGTSMAAPHVSGAAAVLRGLGLSPQATVDRLLATAKDLGNPGADSIYGAGRLDLAKAVQGLSSTSSSSSPAPSASSGARTGSQSTGSPGPGGSGGGGSVGGSSSSSPGADSLKGGESGKAGGSSGQENQAAPGGDGGEPKENSGGAGGSSKTLFLAIGVAFLLGLGVWIVRSSYVS
jgi:thermitase